MYGPWETRGSPGQGGVNNAYWIATVNEVIPSGTYQVGDSDPATWANNGESNYCGMSEIFYSTSGSSPIIKPTTDLVFPIDFEDNSLDGWHIVEGDAFDFQPTRGDNPTARNRGQPSNHEGDWWIGTYEKYQGLSGQKPGDTQGDGPQGILESSSFSIKGGYLSFLIGGGSGEYTKVELVDVPNGKVLFSASGKNTETMEKVRWDLSSYSGKTVKIRIVDKASGGWGHINADDFKIIY